MTLRKVWDADDFNEALQQASSHDTHAGSLVDRGRLTDNLFSRSRERRARILDAVAVALLLAVTALLGVAIVLLSSGEAKADPISPEVVSYTAHYGGAVCEVLSEHPSNSGILGVMLAIEDDGLTPMQAGQVIALSVSEICPRHIPLIQAFIAHYGTAAA